MNFSNFGAAGVLTWPPGCAQKLSFAPMVAERFPERERALAAGLFNSGSAVGAILAPPVVVYLLQRTGWQSAFVLVGVLGFVWLVVWWPLYRTPRENVAVSKSAAIPVRLLVRNRFVRAFTFSKIFLDPVWYFYILV